MFDSRDTASRVPTRRVARGTLVTLLALAPVLGFSGDTLANGASGAGAASDAPAVRVEVTLQSTGTSGGLSTQVLHQMLHNPTYLAAIDPFLHAERPITSPGNAVSPPPSGDDRFMAVRCDLIASNVLSLSISGMDTARVERAARLLLDNLTALRPGRLEALKEERLELQQRRRQDAQDLAAVADELKRLRAEAGGLDPHRWLNDVSERYHVLMAEKRERTLELSVDREVRDHLAAKLQDYASGSSSSSGEKDSDRKQQLLAEMETLQNRLTSIQEKLSRDPGDAEATNEIAALLQRLQVIQSDLRRVGRSRQADGGFGNTEGEMRRAQADLVSTERRIAEVSARIAALNELLAQLKTEVLRFRELSDREVQARNRKDEVSTSVRRSDNTLRQLDDEIAREDRPVMRVIAGPTAITIR